MTPLETKLAEALDKAIELVVTEYCGHSRPCSATNKSCSANELFPALDEYNRQLEQEQSHVTY